MKKKSKIKKSFLSRNKAKLWNLMSKYIRLSYMGEDGKCQCVTCGIKREYKAIHAGHFIPKAQGVQLFFDERNVHPQCFRCNVNLGGNGVEYYVFMEKKYGVKVINELRSMVSSGETHDNQFYMLKIAEYQKKLADLQFKVKTLDKRTVIC